MPTGDLVLAMFGSGGDGVVTMGEMMKTLKDVFGVYEPQNILAS